MDFTTYRPLALRTAKMFPTARENLRHAVLGMITEIGEFATEVKRIVVYGKPQDEAMTKHMHEELGDAYWYFPLGFFAIGADPMPLEFGLHIDGDFTTMDIVDKLFVLNAMPGVLGAMVAAGQIEDERGGIIEMMSTAILVLDALCVHMGFDPNEVRAANIEKLRRRFPDAYSDEAAEARADKGGLPATES